MGKLTFLIIHCTATPAGRVVTSDDIRRWHLKGRGWSQVGYSDMIHIDGRIENLVKYDENNIVEPWELTNGAVGMNGISRHVVYVGGLDKNGEQPEDTRTQKQFEAMAGYVKKMIKNHPDILIAGHNQFAAKACPSFDTATWLKKIGVDDKNIYLTEQQKKLKAEMEAEKAKAEKEAKAKADAAKKTEVKTKQVAAADTTKVDNPKIETDGQTV